MNPVDTPGDDKDVHTTYKKHPCVCVLPEQPDAEADHHVVEGVEAHHAHQQILQNNLQGRQIWSH